ncbi:MAG: penicillin acylase family protein, partial [Rhizobiaceae bacterium]
MARLLLITLVIILVAPALGLWFVAQRALPTLDGVLTINALYRLVTVKFDERAIPYIEASSDGDAYFVQGYVTAAQRMFQMDILRRSAEGSLSEVFGNNCIARDKLMHTVGIERLAAAEAKKISPQANPSLQSYTRGVNAYLSSHEGKLPLPFFLLAYKPRPWREMDSIAILKYHQYQMDETWQLDDLRQRILDKFGNGGLAPQLFGAPMVATVEKNAHTTSMLPAREKSLSERPSVSAAPRSELKSTILSFVGSRFAPGLQTGLNSLPIWGSNAWAVSGDASETKGALIACDKHSAFNSPDDWYLCSLTSPKLHMAGATIPGVPGIMIGRNNNVAWAATDLK